MARLAFLPKVGAGTGDRASVERESVVWDGLVGRLVAGEVGSEPGGSCWDSWTTLTMQ